MKHEGHSEHQAEGLSDNPVIRDYQVANNRMHADMAIEFSGDADLDFLRGMIPHHQGAIDMAEIELRYGKDERLRRLAQGIIVEQRQEIAVMQGIISEGGALPRHTEPTATGHPHHGDRP